MRASVKKRNRRYQRIFSVLYPDTFALSGQPKNPLKIGIFQDLFGIHPEIDGYHLGQFLRWYTSKWSYLEAIIEKKPRLDLEGAVCGQITDHQIAIAASELKELKKKAAEAASFPREAA
jgi:sRNA-binding protein